MSGVGQPTDRLSDGNGRFFDEHRQPTNASSIPDSAKRVSLPASESTDVPGSRLIRMVVFSASGSRPASCPVRRAIDHKWPAASSGSPSNPSQPVLLRPTRRIAASLARPIHMGGPSAWTGRRSAWTGGSERNSLSQDTGLVVHHACRNASRSSSICPRRCQSALWPMSCSFFIHPSPTPTSRRPSMSTSSVVSSRARCGGSCRTC